MAVFNNFSPVEWPDAKTLTESIEGVMYIIKNEDMEKMVWNGLKSMGLSSGQRYWMGLYQDRLVSDYIEPGDESQDFGGWRWTDGTKLFGGHTNWYTKGTHLNQINPAMKIMDKLIIMVQENGMI